MPRKVGVSSWGIALLLILSWIVSFCVESVKQVATVLEQFIVTPQSTAHLPILLRVSCILVVAAGKDSEAFQSVRSSA